MERNCFFCEYSLASRLPVTFRGTVEPPCAATSLRRKRPSPISNVTANPKHQNFPSQSVKVGTSSKQPPPVSDRDHFLGLTVDDFTAFF